MIGFVWGGTGFLGAGDWVGFGWGSEVFGGCCLLEAGDGGMLGGEGIEKTGESVCVFGGRESGAAIGVDLSLGGHEKLNLYERSQNGRRALAAPASHGAIRVQATNFAKAAKFAPVPELQRGVGREG